MPKRSREEKVSEGKANTVQEFTHGDLQLQVGGSIQVQGDNADEPFVSTIIPDLSRKATIASVLSFSVSTGPRRLRPGVGGENKGYQAKQEGRRGPDQSGLVL